MKIYLILALFTIQIFNYCFKGCLKCTTDDICLYCDITQGYQLYYGACIKQEEDQLCLKKDIKNVCLQCQQGLVLSFDNQCISIASNKIIKNCYKYIEEQCMYCKTGYYLNNYYCKAVEKLIDNCMIYIQNEQCMICQDGYYVNYDRSQCIEITKTQQCFGFSFLNCKQCSKGYLYNENNIIEQLKQINNIEEFNMIVQDYVSQQSLLYHPNLCQKIIIENCQIYKTFNKCFKCYQGYFLDKNQLCQQFPRQKINHCEIYENDNSCLVCENQYYTTDNQTCIKIPEIKNCLEYDNRKEIINCRKCTEQYFLNDKYNKCELRIQSHEDQIQNCLKKDLKRDCCLECEENYILSKDRLKCKPIIPNCQIHHEFYQNQINIYCKQCNQYFYLKEQQCVEGTIENCLTYSISQNTCTQCENEFYLTENKSCQKHDLITNCSIYSNEQSQVCEFCNHGYYNFFIKQYCVNLNIIDNCEQYSNDQNQDISLCKKCEDGYYLFDNKCEKILIKNCTQFDQQNQLCEQCIDNHFLFKYKKDNQDTIRCQEYLNYIKQGCQQFDKKIGVNNYQCSVCKKDFIPFNANQYFVCINIQNLDFKEFQIQQHDPNCLKYREGICIKCKDNYFIHQQNNTCILESCSGKLDIQQTYIPISFQQDNGFYFINQIKKCIVDIQNHLIRSQDFLLEQFNILDNFITIKCKSNSLDTVDLDLNDKSYSIYNTQGNVEDILHKQPQVNCPQKQDINFINEILYDDNNKLITNCQYYINYSQGKYGCIKCNIGYKGFIDQQESQYISECLIDKKCQISSTTKNLDVYWQKLVSCYSCLDQNLIPYIIYQSKEKSNPEFQSFISVSVENDNWNYIDGQQKLASMECLPKHAEDFAFQLGIQNINSVKLIDNCAIGFLNLKYNKQQFNSTGQTSPDTYNENQGILCIACKPGYYPKQHNLNYIYKTECIKIDNCISYGGNWFNSCSQCQQNYSYNIINGKVNFNECISNKVQNCYLFDIENNNCVMCQRGYILDKKNICIRITVSQCEDNSFVQNLNLKEIKILTYFHQQSYGCNKCKENYVSIQINDQILKTNICVKNDFIIFNDVDEDQSQLQDTIYIPYCELYKNNFKLENDKLQCNKCLRGYVLTKSKQVCLLNDQYQNCNLVDQNLQQCIVCSMNYSLVNGKCIQGNIQNCQKYNTNISTNQVKCLQCRQDYYLNSQGMCLQGHVQNCLAYGNTEFQCTKCKDNYYLISQLQNENNKSYCFPISYQYKCQEAQISNSKIGANFYCTKCQNKNGVLIQPDQQLTSCLNFQEIKNCQKYDTQKQLYQTSFLCLQCSDEYYIINRGNQCKLRQNQINNCIEYYLDKDQCQYCKQGYYFDLQNQECKKFPTGIPYCIDYIDFDICSQCQQNMYLINNQCLEIPEQFLIKNCQYYSNQYTCQDCLDGFLLSGNECFKTKIVNCKKPQNLNDCLQCNEDFELVIKNEQNVCLEIPLQNCIEYNFSQGKCIQCQQQFYITEVGDCQSIITPIQNCDLYQGEDICNQCQQGYALTPDKKRCQQIDFLNQNNCQNLQIIEELNCSICKVGYTLQNGVCVQENKQFRQGCLFYDNSLNEKCILCKPGYYMKSEQQCIFIIEQKERQFIFEYKESYNITILLIIFFFQLNFKLFNINNVLNISNFNLVYFQFYFKQVKNIIREVLTST